MFLWTGLGIIWTGCWIHHGTKTQELVPFTGRSRYAGKLLPNGLIYQDDGLRMTITSDRDSTAILLALGISEGDPRYVRVKGILERILPSTGLQYNPWKLIVTKLDGW